MLTTEEPADTSGSSELLSRARDGDADAFRQLARDCEARLYQQALALCHDPAAAEDLAAETLIEAWKSLSRFDGRCRFSTWLYAILVHRFQKLLRAQKTRPVPLAWFAAGEAAEREALLGRVSDASPAPSEQLAQQEASRQLQQAIRQLPRKHQQVILMRFFEGASVPEIAAALGLPSGTVKSRLHHALEKLRHMETVLNVLGRPGDTGL